MMKILDEHKMPKPPRDNKQLEESKWKMATCRGKSEKQKIRSI